MVGRLFTAAVAVIVGAMALFGHLLIATTPVAPHHTSAQPSPAPGPSPAPPGLRMVADPDQVTGTLAPGSCHYRDGGSLPDPRCTPGSIEPGETVAAICTPGHAASLRPPEAGTEAFKYDVAYPAYGTPQSTRTELDHLVPLELGGSNDASNLWPEVPPSPNPKDTVEDALHRAVCDGRVPLAEAQRAIAADWQTAEQVTGTS